MVENSELNIKGRGWFDFRKGDRIRDIKKVKVGDIILEYSKRFHAKNTFKVTRIGNGITNDLIIVAFVDSNGDRTDDYEWAIWHWSFEMENGSAEYYDIKGE